MAKKKQEEPKAGAPAWMATFSDLMNLLLCFFVLLFAMSSVDQEKFDIIVNSLRNTFSILPAGGASLGDGALVGAGISQLANFDIFYRTDSNSDSNVDSDTPTEDDMNKEFEKAAVAESEQIAEQIEAKLQQLGIGDKVEVDVTAQYARLTLNGALLFDSGEGEFCSEAVPLVDKLGKVVAMYPGNMVGIEGHTDNVPVAQNGKYESNDVLSFHRALSVKNYFTQNNGLSPGNIRPVGCGEFSPVADNGTPEGRAMNRRVEIKIYNSFANERGMGQGSNGNTDLNN